MSMKCTQISLPDVFHNCQDMFLSSSPTFFSLLEENIDISDFIPLEFKIPHFFKKHLTYVSKNAALRTYLIKKHFVPAASVSF